MLKQLLLWISLAGFCQATVPVFGDAKPLKIVTTIKPLQLIVMALTQEKADVHAIIPENQSPHTYQLRPSARYQMANADIFIWIGPQLETFMTKLADQLSRDITMIAVISEVDFPLRRLSVINSHADASDHGHWGENRVDPHIWLSPRGGIAIARVILTTLLKKDPDNAAYYEKNFENFVGQMEELKQKIFNEFSQLKARNYLVYHDGYGYFEDEVGTKHTAVVTINPENLIGAKHWLDVRQLLKTKKVGCVILEPQFKSDIIDSFRNEEGLKLKIIDPLGGSVANTPDGYKQFLAEFADDFKECLSQ